MPYRIKFPLTFAFAILIISAVIGAVPVASRWQSQRTRDDGELISGTNGKMRRYPNNVVKLEPNNFAISKRLRDLPDAKTYADDAFRKGGPVNRQRRIQRINRTRERKGLPRLTDEEVKTLEVNWRNARRIKKVAPGAGAGLAEFTDPVIHAVDPNAPQAMPTPSLTFDGATQADNSSTGAGGATPPDVNGDVGPNHYVSSVNLSLKIFNKDGSLAAPAKKTSDIFSSLPSTDPCRSRNDGDPIVLYDSLADRWFITQFSVPADEGIGTSNYECVAVSQTADPTGAYYVWSYEYPGGLFNDYPKVGVWTDAYHMTFNQFDSTGGWAGLGVLSQDRMSALAGDPEASAIYYDVSSLDPFAGGALPSDIDGLVPPPAGMPQIIAEMRADEYGDPNDAIRLYKWAPDFANPTNSVFTPLGDTVLAAFDARRPDIDGGHVEQSGGTALDSIAERLMHRFAYRNLGTASSPVNSYVGSFTVNVSGVDPSTSISAYQTGVRWFEFRRTNDTVTVRDQGTHVTGAIDGANGLNNWMSSIAQDNAGNIALGFSQAGTTQNADIKIAGRTGTATGGGLNEGEALFWDALGSQTSGFRWGDYSMMSVDPTDECTFWYTQEYYATNSPANWSTRVGKFKYPGCSAASKGTISGTITSCSTAQPVSEAVVLATGGFHRLSGGSGTYSMSVTPGNYTVTADKGIGVTGTPAAVNVTAGGTATANICLNGVAVASAGEPSITSESCALPNGRPDPGEQLTVSLPISNIGVAGTTNLVATLQASGGVAAQVSQSYGAIAPSAAAVSRDFTFTVNGSLTCGNQVTLTWTLVDGTTNLGTVTKTYQTGVPQAVLSQNFDSVTEPALPATWTSAQTTGTAMNWVTSATSPSSSPNAAFANGPVSVSAAALVSPSVNIASAPASVTFKKRYDLEDGFDGAVLEIKIGAGSWQDIVTAGGSFVSGGYDGPISNQYSSPIGNRNAWTGTSTTYTTTEASLPSAAVGQSIQLRWRVATDDGNASSGFRVDDVVISSGVQCASCGSSSGSVAGTVRYYFGTSPVAVPGVTLTAAGSPQVTASTSTTGSYSLTGLGGGAYTVTPSKTGAVNGLNSLDASRVAQYAAGLITLTANQLIAADASGNGAVNSFDASRIAQTVVGIPNTGIAGTWKFSPASKNFTSVTSAVTGENFDAILVGDVTGNWTAGSGLGDSDENADLLAVLGISDAAAGSGLTGPLGISRTGLRGGTRETPVRVSIAQGSSAKNGGTVRVPIRVGDLTGLGVTAFDFLMSYDSRSLRLIEVIGTGALTEKFLVTPNVTVTGRLRLSAFGVQPLSGSGDLLYLVFERTGDPRRGGTLRWENFVFNEGEVRVQTTGGTVGGAVRGR